MKSKRWITNLLTKSAVASEERAQRQWLLRTAFLVALLTGAVFAGAYLGARAERHSLAAERGNVAVAHNGAAVPLTGSFAPVVKAALPAVVSISSSRTVKSEDAAPLFNDPFFRQFFGPQAPNGKPRAQREQGLGSGVIIGADGLILTNNHVIADASEVKVSLGDKRELNARVIGADPQTDIAVIKVDAKDLPTLPWADSANVEVGDLTLAIGNPFGVGKTVTMGIVSATGRGNLGIEDYEDFIQTDAAINPGNSGGALINTRGELIGINTAILADGTRGNQGVGFAVPSNLAQHVMQQILKQGKVTRGYLGVQIQEVTPALAKAFQLREPGGALVGDVTADSPAAQAGLSKGDVIMSVNGQNVGDSRSLRLRISQMAPGTEVRLTLLRNGNTRDVTVKLGELPGTAVRANWEGKEENILAGVTVDDLTPQIARQMNLPASVRGALVVEVQDGTAADTAGLQRGDVIQEVNRQSISNAAEFARAVKQAGTQPLLLLVNRQGRTSFVVIER